MDNENVQGCRVERKGGHRCQPQGKSRQRLFKNENHPSDDPGEDPDEDGRVGDPRQVRNKIYLTIQTAAASPSNFDISLSTEDKDVLYARPLSCFTTSFISLGFRVLQARENAGTCCLGRYILPQTWLSPLFHKTYGYTAEIQTVLRRLCCFLWIRIEDLDAVATFTAEDGFSRSGRTAAARRI